MWLDAFSLLQRSPVPHPFRFFLRNGWEANKLDYYTISENVISRLDVAQASRSPASKASAAKMRSFVNTCRSLAANRPMANGWDAFAMSVRLAGLRSGDGPWPTI